MKAVWLLVNGIIFWNTYRLYKGQPQYYYLYQILGVSHMIFFFFFSS